MINISNDFKIAILFFADSCDKFSIATFILSGLALYASKIILFDQPYAAVKDVDIIYTDVWASMGQEAETEERKKVFKDYQVNSRLISNAKKDCLFIEHL